MKAYYPVLIGLLIAVVVLFAMMFILTFFLFLVKMGFEISWFNGVSQKAKDTLTPLIALALFMGCGAVVVTHFAHP